MNRSAVIYLVTRYVLVYGVITVGFVYIGSLMLPYSFGIAALVLIVVAVFVGPLSIAGSDGGLRHVEDHIMIGAHSSQNAEEYTPSTQIALGCYLLGVALFSIGGLLLLT